VQSISVRVNVPSFSSSSFGLQETISGDQSNKQSCSCALAMDHYLSGDHG
jgi:hypothetical protein